MKSRFLLAERLISPMFIGNTNQEEEFKDEWREKSILEDYWKAEKFLGDSYRW
jgi:hypothetical protein